MDERLPLGAMLSQLLTAFIIEFDNEFEHRMPHRTTNHGSTGSSDAPWLVSMAMWVNTMRFVGEEGISLRELERLSQAKANLSGMERWGYVSVAPDPADPRPKPPRNSWIIHATPAGRQAQGVWRPLTDMIETRWLQRFGAHPVDRLRHSLLALIGQFDVEMPECLPIVQYGLFSKPPNLKARSRDGIQADSQLPLAALFSQALLAFAIEFEQNSQVSLAVWANALRLINAGGARPRDLPRQSGVSKEAIATSLSFLTARGYARLELQAEKGAAKVVRLTAKGEKAQRDSVQLVTTIEQRWQERYGKGLIETLRQSLEDVLSQKTALFLGLEPYPDGWRASVPRIETLPHFPVISHRGGFPDGS